MTPRRFFLYFFVVLAAFLIYNQMVIVWSYQMPQGILENQLKNNKDIGEKEVLGFIEFMQYAVTILGGIIIVGQICRSIYLITEECYSGDTVEMVFTFFIAHSISLVITIATTVGIFYVCTEVSQGFVFGGALWVGLICYVGWQGLENDKHYTIFGIGYALHQYANDLWDNQYKKVEFQKGLEQYLSTSKY